MNQQLTELKAKAYDIISSIEHLQRELAATNAQIGSIIEKMNVENDRGISDNDN